MNTPKLTVLAIVAHPDDIEFRMAGTLLLLKDAGADIHMWNLANGCCGSTVYSYEDIIRIRWDEAQAAAREAGATIHPPIVDDICILYTSELIARVTAVVRRVKPDIILTHAPQDYMEDHMIASRLAVTAATVRGAPNFPALPPTEAWQGSITVYHATPHGSRDPLRKLVRSGQYVDITTVMARKHAMLAKHQSQQAWLDSSQGMSSYLDDMEILSRDIGRQSGRFEYAEGWRRHAYQGLSTKDVDPLTEALGNQCWVDPAYEESLG